MSELPRHPKYNTLKKRGSNKYGRERLFQVLNKYGVWDQAISLCHSVYLEPTDDENEQRNRLRLLGIALYMTGETAQADKHLAEIQGIIDAEKEKEKKSVTQAQEKAKKDFESKWAKDQKNRKSGKEKKEKALKTALDKAKSDSEKKHRAKYSSYEKIVKAIEGFRALKNGDYKTAYDKIKSAGGQDETLIAEIQFLKGDKDAGLAAVKKSVGRRKNEVIPLARYAYLLDLAGKTVEAKKAFEDLRKISSSIELRSELFSRLGKLAKACGYKGDWRKEKSFAADIGVRPDLDELGPIHWQPSVAPRFELTLPKGNSFRLDEYKGRTVVVIFYLGASCLHCAEQLQAFAPQKQKFEKAGIEMVAISTDDQEKLLKSINDYGEKMPIPLMSNAKLDVFKKYRAYDDFEKQPLHGTFLVDEEGLIRWQDISYEPFMDHDFLYKESLRLLAQKKISEVHSVTKAK